MKYRYLIFILSIFFFLQFSSCNKPIDVVGEVQLFLIDSFETSDGFFKINEASVVTENEPFIKYSEFISYNSKEYSFKISEGVQKSIKDNEQDLFGKAFAIKANDTLIYTGYFWAGYSSQSVDWTTIDIISVYIGNTLRVSLGYPGDITNGSISDKRNDARILDIFRRDNKLID